MIVAEAPYETVEPTVDSQIVRLKASGADILILFSSNKFSRKLFANPPKSAGMP
jgi:branched-chain amino acid transport system substrate-binding protein